MHESEVAQSCPTVGDPMDCSPPGSSIHGIFQARGLEWGAIAFSTVDVYCRANAHPTFSHGRQPKFRGSLSVLRRELGLEEQWPPGWPLADRRESSNWQRKEVGLEGVAEPCPTRKGWGQSPEQPGSPWAESHHTSLARSWPGTRGWWCSLESSCTCWRSPGRGKTSKVQEGRLDGETEERTLPFISLFSVSSALSVQLAWSDGSSSTLALMLSLCEPALSLYIPETQFSHLCSGTDIVCVW